MLFSPVPQYTHTHAHVFHTRIKLCIPQRYAPPIPLLLNSFPFNIFQMKQFGTIFIIWYFEDSIQGKENKNQRFTV